MDLLLIDKLYPHWPASLSLALLILVVLGVYRVVRFVAQAIQQRCASSWYSILTRKGYSINTPEFIVQPRLNHINTQLKQPRVESELLFRNLIAGLVSLDLNCARDRNRSNGFGRSGHAAEVELLEIECVGY